MEEGLAHSKSMNTDFALCQVSGIGFNRVEFDFELLFMLCYFFFVNLTFFLLLDYLSLQLLMMQLPMVLILDIISVSLGGYSLYYFENPISIGAFHATITNLWPWSLSVAASTTDRQFFTKVKLGNNRVND